MQPLEVFHKKGFLKNFVIFTKNTCVGVFSDHNLAKGTFDEKKHCYLLCERLLKSVKIKQKCFQVKTLKYNKIPGEERKHRESTEKVSSKIG